MEARIDINAYIVRYTWFLEAKDEANHLVVVFFFIKAGVEQCSSGKANDWRNRERVVLDLFSVIPVQCSECQSGEKFQTSAVKQQV